VGASPARAFTFPAAYFGYCSSASGSETYSPGLPPTGKGMVTPTINATFSIGGCVNLGGPTSGTGVWSGTTTDKEDCFSFAEAKYAGNLVITWNTGQTSTVSSFPIGSGNGGEGQITSGFQVGNRFQIGFEERLTTPGGCSRGVPDTSASLSFDVFDVPLLAISPTNSTTCVAPQACDLLTSLAPTPASPGLLVSVTGTPASGTGTVNTHMAPGSFHCPSVPNVIAPVADLTDTGFAPSDLLTVTATLPLTASTNPQQVCFNSTQPFLSQSSPTVPASGPGLLLLCTQTANVAPCVLSSSQVGTDEVVKFVVPGGDPKFDVVAPKAGKVWLSGIPIAQVHLAYSARLYASGGLAPVHWSKVSGNLPPGCALNPKTGAITGKPTKKGNFTFVVQAKDSEKKPQISKMIVPIIVN